MRYLLLLLAILASAVRIASQPASAFYVGADACGDEARSQFVLLKVGAAPYNFAAQQPVISTYCPTDGVVKSVDAYVGNNFLVSQLGAFTGNCQAKVFANLFAPPYNGFAPPGSTILVFLSANPDFSQFNNFTFAPLCGQNSILVAFGNYQGLVPFFKNANPLDPDCGNYVVTEVNIGTSVQYINYDPKSLAAQDGAFAAVDPVDLLRYGNSMNCMLNGLMCSNPANVLFTGDLNICAGETTIITANAGAGYTYQWSTGETTASITVKPLSTTHYFVTVSNLNQPLCRTSAKASVNVFSNPAVDLYTEGVSGSACYNEKLLLKFDFEQPPITSYTHVWSPPQPNIVIEPDESIIINEHTAGQYKLTITYSNGCVFNGDLTAGYPAQSPIVICSNAPVCEGEPVTLQASTHGDTFLWSGPGGYSATGSEQEIPGAIAGLYTVTVTDDSGCTRTGTIPVAYRDCMSPLELTGVPVSTTCGLNNGELSIGVTGGVSPYQYDWSHTSTNNDPASFSDLPSGNYTVTVTDLMGVSSTLEAFVGSSLPLQITFNSTGTSCAQPNGAISVVISNSNAPISFDWADITTNPEPTSRSGLLAGTYSLTVTDANNCTISGTTEIAPSNGAFINASTTHILCGGDSSGVINVTVTGGGQPYTYNWNDIVSSPEPEDRAGIPAGTYYLTVTATNGCTDTLIAMVQQPPTINLTASSGDATCGLPNGWITVNMQGGVSPYTYDWSDLSGTNNPPNRTALAAGTYTVTVYDGNGCSQSIFKTITMTSSSPVLTLSPSGTTCGQPNGAVSVSITNGTSPFSYNWADLNTNPEPGSRTGLAAGIYTLTVTDANLCTNTSTTTIASSNGVTADAAITNVSCEGGNNGAINVTVSSGVSPFSFNWADISAPPEPEDRTSLTTGSYFLTVTASDGCTNTVAATIQQPASITISVAYTNARCGLANGSISLNIFGGVSPFTFDWADLSGSNNPQNRTGLDAGTYTVTVTDANGCTKTSTTTITQSGNPSASAVITNVSCFGGANGAIQVTTTGGSSPYTYNWADISTPPEPEDRANILSGTYNLTITDALSCTFTNSYSVTQPSAISVSVSVTGATCGTSNGSINLTVSGGVSPYSYNWQDLNSPPEPEDRNNLSAGTYTVTITDANNCTVTATATVNQTGIPTLSAVVTNLTCNGNYSGAINLTVTGGNSPYIYNWSDINTPPEPEDRTGLYASTYTVTVTSASGCTVTGSWIVTQPTLLSVGHTVNNTTCGLINGSINTFGTGGTSPYTYDWYHISGNNDPANLTDLAQSTYHVTVSDFKGCTATKSINVGGSTPVSLSHTVTHTSCGLNNAAITVSASGGGPTGGGGNTYTYDWGHIPGSSNIQNLTNLWPGVFHLTVTSSFNCTGTSSTTINSSTAVTVTSQIVHTTCNSRAGEIDITASGANAPYTYNWQHISGNNNPEDLTQLYAGAYTVTVTSSNGCTKSRINTVTNTGVPPAIAATLTHPTGGNSNGAITLAISGGSAPYTYIWSNGSTTKDISGLSPGTYTVTVTEATGCTAIKVNVLTSSQTPNNGLETLYPTLNADSPGGDTILLTIGEVSLEKAKIYPNPSDGFFIVELPSAFGYSTIEVYDVLSRQLIRMEGAGKVIVNSLSFASGIYHVLIQPNPESQLHPVQIPIIIRSK